VRVQFNQPPRNSATNNYTAACAYAVVGFAATRWAKPPADVEGRRRTRQTWSASYERREVLSKGLAK